MVAAGVALDNDTAVKTVLVLIGAGLTVVGVLLPRLAGTLEISPTNVKIPIAGVIERLEATRQIATMRAPDRVDEAVGHAYRLLAPFLTVEADGDARADRRTAPSADVITCQTCGHDNHKDSAFCQSCRQFLAWAAETANRTASLGDAATMEAEASWSAPAAELLREPPRLLRPAPAVPAPAGAPGVLQESPAAFANRVLRELS
jgi:hypothetical protein